MKRVRCVYIVPVAVPRLVRDITAMRHDQIKRVLCPCHGDIKQPTLFIDFFGRTDSEV